MQGRRKPFILTLAAVETADIVPKSKPDEQKTEKIKTERKEEKKTAEEKKGPPQWGGDWQWGNLYGPLSARFRL